MGRSRRSGSRDPGAGTSAPSAERHGGAAGIPAIDTRALFGDAREVILVHDGQEYRLRCTSSGKLILTK